MLIGSQAFPQRLIQANGTVTCRVGTAKSHRGCTITARLWLQLVVGRDGAGCEAPAAVAAAPARRCPCSLCFMPVIFLLRGGRCPCLEQGQARRPARTLAVARPEERPRAPSPVCLLLSKRSQKLRYSVAGPR